MNSTTTRKLNSSSIGIPNLTIISLNNFLVVFNQYLTIYFYPVGIVLTIGTNVIAIGTLASRSIDNGLSQRMHQYYMAISVADLIRCLQVIYGLFLVSLSIPVFN